MFKGHPEVNRSLAGDIRETVFDKSRIAEQLDRFKNLRDDDRVHFYGLFPLRSVISEDFRQI